MVLCMHLNRPSVYHMDLMQHKLKIAQALKRYILLEQLGCSLNKDEKLLLSVFESSNANGTELQKMNVVEEGLSQVFDFLYTATKDNKQLSQLNAEIGKASSREIITSTAFLLIGKIDSIRASKLQLTKQYRNAQGELKDLVKSYRSDHNDMMTNTITTHDLDKFQTGFEGRYFDTFISAFYKAFKDQVDHYTVFDLDASGKAQGLAYSNTIKQEVEQWADIYGKQRNVNLNCYTLDSAQPVFKEFQAIQFGQDSRYQDTIINSLNCFISRQKAA